MSNFYTIDIDKSSIVLEAKNEVIPRPYVQIATSGLHIVDEARAEHGYVVLINLYSPQTQPGNTQEWSFTDIRRGEIDPHPHTKIMI